MKKFNSIFQFELANYFKNKVFIILTVVLIVGISGFLSFPRIKLLFANSEQTSKPEEIESTVAISGVNSDVIKTILSASDDSTEYIITDEAEDVLKQKVTDDEYDGVLLFSDVLSYKYLVKNIGMHDNTTQILDKALTNIYQTQVLTTLGADTNSIESFFNVKINSEIIKTENGKDQMENFLYTYILIMGLYMAILLYGQFVASSVATEKTSRAMELLITSANPNELMFGKVLGTGFAGILQFTLILGSGFIAYNLNAEFYTDNFVVQSVFNMPLEILIYVLIFFILGFFIYAFLYGALGSVVSRLEELNVAVMPVTFVFIGAFMIVMFSMSSGNVDNTLMKIISFIPLTSPMAMFVRIAMGEVSNIEMMIAIVILIISTVLIGYLAAIIYRVGVLMYGQPPKIKEIIKTIKANKKTA